MATLEGLTSIGQNVRVYVPSTIHAEPAPPGRVAATVEEVLERMSRWFGGATAHNNAEGAWFSEELDRVVRESVTIIESFASSDALATNVESVVALCEEIKELFEQEAVSLEVNGRLYFV